MRRSTRALWLLSGLACLAGCAGHGSAPSVTADDACAPARAQLASAAAPALTWRDQPREQYWVRLAATEPKARVSVLAADYRVYLETLERLADSAALLKGCAGEDAAMRGVAPAGIDQAVDARGAALSMAAERLLAQNPSSRSRAAAARWAVAAPVKAYLALSDGAVLAAPTKDAARLAGVRRGARLIAAATPAPAGWTSIELNDGSRGYIDTAALKPIAPNASAVTQAARATAMRKVGDDPLAMIAFGLNTDAPARRASLDAALDATGRPTEMAARSGSTTSHDLN